MTTPLTVRLRRVGGSVLRPELGLAPNHPRAAAVAPDPAAVRVVARLRLVLAVVVAATGSFLPNVHGSRATFFLLLGLVWVPWACSVMFAADRATSRFSLIAGPAGDVLLLLAVQTLLPGTMQLVLPAYLVVVAFTTYSGGRRSALPVAAAVFAALGIAQATAPARDRITTAELVVFTTCLVALLFLLGRTALQQAITTARAEGLRTRADVILAHIADAVMVTDETGRIVQANPAVERLVGNAVASKGGARCADVLGLHVGERRLDCSQGCALLKLRADEPGMGHEVWRQDLAGNRQPLLANAVALRGDQGTEVVHSLRDVTRLKQAEEAKTMFLATASHELKTPLTVISGFAETLLKYSDFDRATQSMALEAIRSRARELTRIVDRLLLSSRIEAGRIELINEPLDITPLVQERVSALAGATGRTITLSSNGPLRAFANADSLTTVVDHLLENALKYSPNGGPVTVALSGSPDATLVRVSDEGIGMDAEQLEHCFDKFWQAESSDVRRFGGTGIGLYIVHSLVEAMGGRMQVESVLGKGSTFTVVLAVKAAVPVTRQPGVGESTSIREFMRQLGVPEGRR